MPNDPTPPLACQILRLAVPGQIHLVCCRMFAMKRRHRQSLKVDLRQDLPTFSLNILLIAAGPYVLLSDSIT